jgi:transposase
MEVVNARCAGIDVHKRMVMAHARLAEGPAPLRKVMEFGTFTQDLLAMRDWLHELGVTHIAMESTGVFWRPLYNVLEDEFEILVCNAHHIKNVPGRKTDVKDAQWIADLLAHGLLKPSFVPGPPQRALRDLTRARSQYVAQRARLSNQIQKLLEECNIKLSSVASDVLGVSGRAMLAALAAGQDDSKTLANYARRSLRKKLPQLGLALQGRMRSHQRTLLREHLNQVESLDRSIRALESAIDETLKQEPNSPFESAVAVIQTHPGIAETSARAIVSEIGADMARFGSAERLCAWSGMAPGNHQSAGKRLSGKTLKANRYLRSILVEVAQSAANQKGTYSSALYARLAARRGKKRALIAVGHSVLRSLYYMISNGQPYKELGANHFDELNRTRIVRRLTQRASSLGFELRPALATNGGST